MQETEKRASGFKAFVLRYLCDPVLIYTVVVMMSIMYHYRDKLTAFYGALTLVIAFLLFRLFDYMNRHKVIGGAAYCFVGYVFIQAAMMCMMKGEDDYPLPFAVWFITPQIAMDYNKWYTMAIYLMFMLFMSSVIYYFTRIRYRIFMSFLVFIIPFAIYGKENETMPIPFIIILSMIYIVLMVYFRQMRDDGTTVLVARQETWKSVGVFTLVFAVIAAIVPKPAVETDRTLLETMISAERFTDRLVSMLSAFRDTSSGAQFRDVNNTTPLYYVKAEEGAHLKNATFTSYDYYGDYWSSSDKDKEIVESYDIYPWEVAEPGALTEAILSAAQHDRDYAKKYGLTRFLDSEVYIPAEKEMTVYSVYAGKTQYAPVPEGLTSVNDTSFDGLLEYMETGLIRSQGRFGMQDEITLGYRTDLFFDDPTNLDIISAIPKESYEDLLKDGYDVLYDAYFEIGDPELLHQAFLLDDEYLACHDFGDYLDYGDSDRIYDLAMEITEGLETDYEKAKAIEIYFYENDYIYDLKYVKSRGENVESFLFRTKRGVCVEYATAMVLLSRAAGIPARYCEGFNMSAPFTGAGEYQNVNYVITPQDAHAYPELYINGYGWTYFEPTIADEAPEENKRTLAQALMSAGFMLLGLLVVIIVFMLLYPTMSHKFFLARSKKRSANDTVKAVMRRICRIYGFTGFITSHEAAGRVYELTGADISGVAQYFDEAVYGETELSEDKKNKAIEEYISAYNAFKETKKKRRMTAKNV